jgi:antitoxin (DNA-binding transcriptional repressor) of toxin-antitoxin stability system
MPTPIINARELSKRPAQVLESARKSGAVVITQNGQPAGLMFPTSARGLEADVDLIRRVRLAQSIDATRVAAIKSGADQLAAADIAAEVASVRKARKRRAA